MLLTRKRAEANGSQGTRCRSKLAAHYLAAALTNIHSSPQALASKAPMRGTVKRKYILFDCSYIREALDSNSDLSCCRVAPSGAKTDRNKKFTLAKTLASTQHPCARPNDAACTRVGTRAHALIDSRSTAAAAPRLRRS